MYSRSPLPAPATTIATGPVGPAAGSVSEPLSGLCLLSIWVTRQTSVGGGVLGEKGWKGLTKERNGYLPRKRVQPWAKTAGWGWEGCTILRKWSGGRIELVTERKDPQDQVGLEGLDQAAKA